VAVPPPRVKPKVVLCAPAKSPLKPRGTTQMWPRFAAGLIGVCIVITLVCGGVGFAFHDHITEPDFHRYDSKDGRFAVDLPGRVYTARPMTWGPNGITSFPMVGVERAWPDEHYLVAWMEIPKEQLALGEGLIMDEAINSAANVDGMVKAVERTGAINVGHREGREAILTTSHLGGKAILRVAVAHGRLYIIFVGGGFIQPDSTRARRFLDSFRWH
jgi:hypothetical protein